MLEKKSIRRVKRKVSKKVKKIIKKKLQCLKLVIMLKKKVFL